MAAVNSNISEFDDAFHTERAWVIPFGNGHTRDHRPGREVIACHE